MIVHTGHCRACGLFGHVIAGLCPADFAECETHEQDCLCPLCVPRDIVAATVEKLVEVLN